VHFALNSASVGATKLDWEHAIVGGPLTVLGGPINLPASAELSLGGTIEQLDIAGYVSGSAGFDFAQSVLNVTLPGGTTPVDVTLVSFTLSDLHLFVGTADAGLEITSGDVSFGSVAPRGPPADTRRWFGLNAPDLPGSSSVTKQLVDVTVDSQLLHGASLLAVTIDSFSLKVGTDTVGVTLGSGLVKVAVLGAPVPTAPATDTRSWLGIDASGISGSI